MKTEHIAALGVVGYLLLDKVGGLLGDIPLPSIPTYDFSGVNQSFNQVARTIQQSVPQFTVFDGRLAYTPAITGPLAASNNTLPDEWKCWLV